MEYPSSFAFHLPEETRVNGDHNYRQGEDSKSLTETVAVFEGTTTEQCMELVDKQYVLAQKMDLDAA